MKLGPYDIIGELGRGGMGVVFRARHATLGHEVALKVVDPETIAGTTGVSPADLVGRFRREAAAAARLSAHPGIVAVRDVGEGFVASDSARPVFYLAMDLVEGRSLDRVIAEGELTVREAVAIAAQVARALAAAHAAGILHRDVKPANILIGFRRGAGVGVASESASTRTAVARVLDPAAAGEAGPCAYLTDFGLATLRAADAAVTRLTRSDTLLGTPAYMSPEQASGAGCDARADVYGLGATLYEALAGEPPFGADTTLGVLTRVLREPPPPLRRRAPEVPAPLAAIVERCLAKAPVDRYPSAAALAEELEGFLAGAVVAVWRVGPWRRLGGRIRAHPARAGVAALGVVGAAATGVWTWHAAGRADRDAANVDATRAGTGRELRATNQAAAYGAMVARTAAALRWLEDYRRHDRPAAARATAAARVAEVAAAAREVAAQFPGAAGPAVLAAIAATDAGDDIPGRALADQVRTADDPLAIVLGARQVLTAWAEAIHLPGCTLGEDGIHRAPFIESAAATALRAHAAALLARARATPTWPLLRQGDELLAFAAGATHLAEQRYAEAAAALAEPTAHPLLEGDARDLRGVALYLAGDYAGAAGEWSHGLARDWPRAGALGALAHLAEGVRVALARGDPLPHLDRAIAAGDRAVALAPGWRLARADRGLAHLTRADFVVGRGGDPLADLRAALADFAAVRGDDEEAASAWINAANVHMQLARRASERGEDPVPDWTAALALLDTRLAAAPEDGEGLSARGAARLGLGRVEQAAGLDPRPRFTGAIADYETAVRLHPHLAPAASNLGNAWAALATARGTPPEEARAGLRRAIAAYDHALARWPEVASAWTQRGIAHLNLGLRARELGDSPWADFDRALADLDEAAARAPDSYLVLVNRSSIRSQRGEARVAEGRDGAEEFARGAEDLDRLVERQPGLGAARLARARLWRRLALHLTDAGEDPRPAHRRTVADADALLAMRAGDLTSRTIRAEARLRIAAVARERGEDAAPDFTAALADGDAILAAAPGHATGHEVRARALAGLDRPAEALVAACAALAGAPEREDLRALEAELRGVAERR